MPIDPSIALSFNPQPLGPNLGQAAQGASVLFALQQQQQQAQRQNALRSILSAPDAIDATGNPTPETLGKVTSIDPAVGITFRQNMLKQQQQEMQNNILRGDAFGKQLDAMHDAYVPILEAYKEAAPNDPTGAQRAADDAVSAKTEELTQAGWLPPNVVQNLPRKFDYTQFEQKYQTVQDLQARRKALLDADRQRREDEKQRAEGWTIETDPTKRDANGAPVQYRYNPKTGEATTLDAKTPYAPGGAVRAGDAREQYSAPTSVQYKGSDGSAVTVEAQQNRQTGQWVTADEKRTPLENVTPIKPLIPGSQAATRAALADDINNDPNFKNATPGQKGAEVERQFRVAQGLINTPEQIDQEAQQIASYSSAPLAGYALRSPEGIKIMARVHELDPNYSALEFNNYNKTIGGFGAGKQGDTIRYINNAIQHIDVMQKAADALGGGDVRAFNTLANALGKEFGVAAPTTFDGLRQIVGTEIERAATGGVGAAVDRDRLIESLNKANSPEQLKDVFKNFKALFGGQAASLKKQYEDGTPDRPAFRADGPFGFDRKLIPATRQELPGFKDENRRPGDAGPSLPRAQQDSGLAPGAKATPEQMQSLPKPKTKAEADALGPGKAFITPDGKIGIVPGSAAPSAPAARPAAPGAAPLPLTQGMKPADLVPGKVYNTRHGPATWDGKQFVAQ